jgi:hypothetical protein
MKYQDMPEGLRRLAENCDKLYAELVKIQKELEIADDAFESALKEHVKSELK